MKNSLLLLCLIFPFLLKAQTDKIPLDSKIKTGQLANGLKYYIIQNKKPEKKIELRMVVNAGSILEDKDQLGLAHLMEHMNFNGLKHFPKNEVVHYLQSIGVDFGADLNAYTSFDETVYILPIPSDDPKKVDQGFQIIADWSGAALLENEEIDKERGVVLEESRRGKGADDRMMKTWLPEYMNGSLYSERLPIGKDDILKNFKYDVIKRFYKDWYRPNLQAIIVVGDIEPAEAERLIKEKFSGFKNPENPRPRTATFDLPMRTGSKAMVLSDKEAAFTTIQIIGNSKQKKTVTTTADYIEELKQNLFNSMIWDRLEELKNSANPPFIYSYGGLWAGWGRGWKNFQLYAMCGSDRIKEATRTLITESLKIKKYGFTASELERAKASMLSDYEKKFNERDKTESNRLIYELVKVFLENEPAPGIEWEYNLVKNKLASISLEDVNKLKSEINIDQNYFALVTTKTANKLPTDADFKSYVEEALATPVLPYQEKLIPSKLLLQEPVAGKTVNQTKDSKIGTTTWTFSNGAKVTYKLTDFKNDEIVFSGYRFGGSSVYAGKDYQSADYSNNVVNEMGYGEFSNTDLQKFLQGKSVWVSTEVDLNNDFIRGQSTVKDLETAMQLLYLKCTSPRRDETAFSSYKSREKQLIEQLKADPENYYYDTLNSFMYHNNPRNKEIADLADYDAIQLDNVLDFYKSRFSTANGMNYFFVGSIPEAQFKMLAEKYIGGLAGTVIESKTKDLNIEPVKGNNSFTVYAGTEPKSMVSEMSYFYTPYNLNDELELNLLAEIINNRITDEIREKMSAIYSGGVSMSLQKFPKEQFMMNTYLPCGPENAEKVKTAFWQIITDCKKPGNIKADELTKAAETALQKQKVGIKTNYYWLRSISKYQQFDLPTENLNNYESRLKQITPENLTTLANKYLSSTTVLHALLMPVK